MMSDNYTFGQEIRDEVWEDVRRGGHEFNEYQLVSKDYAIYDENLQILYPAMGVANEAGELLGKIKKWKRDGTFDRDAIIAEMGDVLWYLAALAEDLDVGLSEVAERNLIKLKDRKDRGVIGGSGDYR